MKKNPLFEAALAEQASVEAEYREYIDSHHAKIAEFNARIEEKNAVVRTTEEFID